MKITVRYIFSNSAIFDGILKIALINLIVIWMMSAELVTSNFLKKRYFEIKFVTS